MTKDRFVMFKTMKSVFFKFLFVFVFVWGAISCSKHSGTAHSSDLKKDSVSGHPPAYVQKAWDARYTYDSDRRLLVPQYAGSRWGAVQQYKEEGVLEYQDWWIRDVRSEDLESSPDTKITSFISEDGVVTEIAVEGNEDPFADGDGNQSVDFGEDDSAQEPSDSGFPAGSLEDETPFVPSPFSPF